MSKFLSLFADFRNLRGEFLLMRERLARMQSSEERLRVDVQAAEDVNRHLQADAERWRDLYFEQVKKTEEAREKHREALELVIDWESQRLMGRQIFHHAPLLQPGTESQRTHIPHRSTGRDAVKEETAKFNAEDESRRMAFFNQQLEQHRKAQ